MNGHQRQWTGRTMVLIAGVAIAAVMFWLSARNHIAPKMAAPDPPRQCRPRPWRPTIRGPTLVEMALEAKGRK